jgi:nucleosome binding factor SPN SPT16 subunit
VTDVGFDETGGKKRKSRYGDEDEIEQEQEDRRRRRELDKVFSDFAKRIEAAATTQSYELEVDMPFRELGLSDVEIVHLERVQFGLKNFDMVFVLSDFKKPPIHINNVPVVHLDNVKEWLE